jgi:Nif-specific regulatory protein
MGRSEAARKLESDIRKAAPAEAPVMLLGESGTGKSSIAQIIHELSGRTAFPFVKLHCFLPEDLLENDLFGSSAKSFLNDRLDCGLTAFDRAAGGTLLLDEVGELTVPHQIKLLDMLDRVRPAGSAATRPKGLDVRLVATAGVDLLEAVSAGSFRKDLLNRLGTLLIHVPSIRERKEDIPFLIKHFLDSVCMEQGKKVHLSRKVMKELTEHDWPGNMAEIKNTVIRLVIMADGAEVEPADLAAVLDPKRSANSGSTGLEGICNLSRLDQMERKEVSAALERNKWIRRKAANDLGLTFRQMNYRVKKFGLDSLIRENRARSRNSI